MMDWYGGQLIITHQSGMNSTFNGVTFSKAQELVTKFGHDVLSAMYFPSSTQVWPLDERGHALSR
jgi:hypothetical protein